MLVNNPRRMPTRCARPDSDQPVNSFDYLTRLPKAELHCHFVATIRPMTLVDLAAKAGLELPSDDPADLYTFDNVPHFLEIFDLLSRVFIDRSTFARVAYEAVEDAVASSNQIYGEYFINPDEFELPLADVIEGMTAGFEAAERAHGSHSRIIVAISRSRSPEDAVALVQSVIDLAAPSVVGIGQDYLADGFQEAPELWELAYGLAHRHGLNCTAHVGEIADAAPSAITVALDSLGCTRIDGGYAAVLDPALLARLSALQIPCTCTPFSTAVRSGWPVNKHHPVAEMIRGGLNVVLGSDDPVMFGTTLAREYADGLPAMGFDRHTGTEIARSGIQASWCEDATKAGLLARFDSEVAGLDADVDRTNG